MYRERLDAAIEKRDCVWTMSLVFLQTPRGTVYLVREKRETIYVVSLQERKERGETAARRNTQQ